VQRCLRGLKQGRGEKRRTGPPLETHPSKKKKKAATRFTHRRSLRKKKKGGEKKREISDWYISWKRGCVYLLRGEKSRSYVWREEETRLGGGGGGRGTLCVRACLSKRGGESVETVPLGEAGGKEKKEEGGMNCCGPGRWSCTFVYGEVERNTAGPFFPEFTKGEKCGSPAGFHSFTEGGREEEKKPAKLQP